jgi:hypothetical protein
MRCLSAFNHLKKRLLSRECVISAVGLVTESTNQAGVVPALISRQNFPTICDKIATVAGAVIQMVITFPTPSRTRPMRDSLIALEGNR